MSQKHNVKPITSLDHFKQLIMSDRVAVIDFWAEWCGPCKMMTPIFEKFSLLKEFEDVDFFSCDTEEQEDVMLECSVKSMPSFMAFQNGTIVKEIKGVKPQELQALLKDSVVWTQKALEAKAGIATSAAPEPTAATATSAPSTTSTAPAPTPAAAASAAAPTTTAAASEPPSASASSDAPAAAAPVTTIPVTATEPAPAPAPSVPATQA